MAREMRRREIQIQIERYITGELTPDQIHELWIEFLKDQELFDCFIIELHLIALLSNIRAL